MRPKGTPNSKYASESAREKLIDRLLLEQQQRSIEAASQYNDDELGDAAFLMAEKGSLYMEIYEK
jgi:hypothetical protein